MSASASASARTPPQQTVFTASPLAPPRPRHLLCEGQHEASCPRSVMRPQDLELLSRDPNHRPRTHHIPGYYHMPVAPMPTRHHEPVSPPEALPASLDQHHKNYEI
eukprot:600702-Rhodomonas_salina.1